MLALFGSVGGEGVPCTEAVSSLQRAWGPMLPVTPLGLFPVTSSAVLSRQKRPKKHTGKRKVNLNICNRRDMIIHTVYYVYLL